MTVLDPDDPRLAVDEESITRFVEAAIAGDHVYADNCARATFMRAGLLLPADLSPSEERYLRRRASAAGLPDRW